MPLFEIEQYEVWTQTYRVRAANKAEAIHKLYAGEVEAVDNSLTYIECDDDRGMPARELGKDLKVLRALGHDLEPDDALPSVRQISEVADDEAPNEDCEHPNAVLSDSTPPATWHCPDCGINFIQETEE